MLCLVEMNSIGETMKTLDIGCGNNKIKGAIGLDIVKIDGVDVVHDLNVFPYPFDDDSFEKIVCYNVLEHIEDVIGTMEEIHRIGNNGCEVEIIVPTPSSFDLWNDFEHRRAFTTRSFDYFTKGTDMFKRNLNKKQFNILHIEFEKVTPRKNIFDKILVKFVNRFKKLYEHRLMYIIQTYSLYYKLQIIK